MNPGTKITARVNTTSLASSRPPSRTNSPRPPSPIKLSESKGSTVGSSAFKPKAKVNSSATVARKQPVVVTTRPASPSKLSRPQNGTLSPTFQPKVSASNVSTRSSVRPQTPVSAPGTPLSRTRNGGSEVGGPTQMRTREGSVSQLHHAMSFSSLQTSSKQQPSSVSPSVRIRSKVSGISKAANEGPLQPTPAAPSVNVAQARFRSPSASSSVSQNGNGPTICPISTSPAANPFRYAPMRPTPAPSHLSYTPPTVSTPDMSTNRPKLNGLAKVDFNSIPPAPASPPVSTLSFSSRSSVSHSSTSRNADSSSSPVHRGKENGMTLLYTPPPAPSVGSPRHQRHGSGNSADFDDGPNPQSPNSNGEAESGHTEQHKVKAEAKSNRKIADLEISNRSLLTINASLETTKNRQAKEIRDLRRKLRESRLALPPRAFRQVKAEEIAKVDDDVSDSDSEVEDAAQLGDGDEIYNRVKVMIEVLLASGKEALEKKVEHFAESSAKVLTAAEVQSWQGLDEDDDHSDLDSVSQGDISITSTMDGEDEDELSDDNGTLFNQNIFLTPSTPPIRISKVF